MAKTATTATGNTCLLFFSDRGPENTMWRLTRGVCAFSYPGLCRKSHMRIADFETWSKLASTSEAEDHGEEGWTRDWGLYVGGVQADPKDRNCPWPQAVSSWWWSQPSAKPHCKSTMLQCAGGTRWVNGRDLWSVRGDVSEDKPHGAQAVKEGLVQAVVFGLTKPNKKLTSA